MKINKIKEQTLLHLYGCIDSGFSYRMKKGLFILDEFPHGWKKINRKELRQEISDLRRFKFIDKNKSNDGSIKILLTEKGKFKALNYKLDNIKNKKEKWDGKWRMVAFDIPEKYKRGRDALRRKLKKIGFCELQKSVLVTPYECEKEIGLLVKYFNLNKYVRFGVLESIDNEEYLKKYFKTF